MDFYTIRRKKLKGFPENIIKIYCKKKHKYQEFIQKLHKLIYLTVCGKVNRTFYKLSMYLNKNSFKYKLFLSVLQYFFTIF